MIPQDLVFIAIGFLLAGISRTIPAFAAQYGSDTKTDLMGFLHIVAYIGVAWILTLCDKVLRIIIQNLRTAWEQIKRFRHQLEFKGWKDAPPGISNRLLLMVLYACGVGIILLTELVLGAGTVAESLQHIMPQ